MEKVFKRLNIAVIAFLAIIVMVFLSASSNENLKLYNKKNIIKATNWTLEGRGKITLPYTVKAVAGEEIVLTGKIPESIKTGQSICIRAPYSTIKVYVDDVCIGTACDVQVLPWSKTNGFVRAFFQLDENMAGAKIKIVFIPHFSFNFGMSPINYGFEGHLVLSYIVGNYLPMLIICTILFSMSVIVLLTAFVQKKQKVDNYGMFYNFALFIFLDVCWIIGVSGFPQVLSNQINAVVLVNNITLACLGIPLSGFFEGMFKKQKKIFFGLKQVGFAIAVIIALLSMTDKFAPINLLWMTHVYVTVIVFVSLYCSLKYYKKSLEMKWTFWSLVAYYIISIAGGIYFFINPTDGTSAMIFAQAFVVFIISMFSMCIYRQAQLIAERQKLDNYRQLAFSDGLTGLGNRAAFEQEFFNMRDVYAAGTRVILFMFDLNFLKKTNDTRGHQEGDRLINGMARCLEKTFASDGKCYRLGGDEFGVIIINPKKKLDEYREDFYNQVRAYNKGRAISISTSMGCEERALVDDDIFARDLYRAADRLLYEDKKKYHNGMPEEKR